MNFITIIYFSVSQYFFSHIFREAKRLTSPIFLFFTTLFRPNEKGNNTSQHFSVCNNSSAIDFLSGTLRALY